MTCLNIIEYHRIHQLCRFLHYAIEIQGIYDISFFVRMTCYVFQYLLEIIRLSIFHYINDYQGNHGILLVR
jgi:hypothetical protein